MIRPEGVAGVAFGIGEDGNPRIDRDTRVRISKELGIPPEWAWVSQVHGSSVIEATEPGVAGEADAIFTAIPKLAVAVSVADCLPVVLRADSAVGVAHAGWRGAAAGVVESLVDAMTASGHAPNRAVIGPGIGPCCFEVGEEVLDRFPRHGAGTTWGTASVDLPGAVRDSLGDIPVLVVDSCTHHDQRFCSFRRDGTPDRQFGVAWL